MLPGFEALYLPALLTLSMVAPSEMTDEEIETEIIRYLGLTPEDLELKTTGERIRNGKNFSMGGESLFKKHFSFAMSDLKKARVVTRSPLTSSWWINHGGIKLLNHMLTDFQGRPFKRSNLVKYSDVYAMSAAHHRTMTGSLSKTDPQTVRVPLMVINKLNALFDVPSTHLIQ